MKRIIQFCALIATLLSIQGVNSLTTFGKTQNSPPSQPTQHTFSAQECTKHKDCHIVNTSCVQSGKSEKMLCLCGDNKPPKNGGCNVAKKYLKHRCDSDENCHENMMCAPGNSTIEGKINICQCAENFEEDGQYCNGGDPTARRPSLFILSLLSTVVFAKLYQ